MVNLSYLLFRALGRALFGREKRSGSV